MFRLTVAFPELFARIVKLTGLTTTAKSVGPLTTMASVVVWTRKLLFAVTTIVYAAGAVEDVVVIVRLEIAEAAGVKLIMAGLIEETRPDCELAERVMVPEKLSRLVRVRM